MTSIKSSQGCDPHANSQLEGEPARGRQLQRHQKNEGPIRILSTLERAKRFKALILYAIQETNHDSIFTLKI
ncbi:MAG: hypothetical protein KGR48_11360 [Alphaproteobacteria bacterium]|nr:hypothetical protein [Alphaproteobacteria bacterium]MDE2013246.1 hypothetical protein [Alphaproteobacteria bacterium]MDE2073572.1 hypothetical protein [Alphaproteobacteria bacterium]MDE2352909.1 hypothetical protein [Alphaproteobacteria bacterium]